MPVLIFILALEALFYFDPAGYYPHGRAYDPPTPVEQLQTDWWAAQMAADISEDNKTHDVFLAEQRRDITRKSLTMGIDPKQVFGEET